MMPKIVCDSREQKALWTRGVIVKKLNVGDYSIEGMENELVCERKALGDLFHSVGTGHKRFRAELQRGLDNHTQIVLMIEGTREQVRDKDFPGAYHTKMKGFVVNKILDTLATKYGIIIVYCKNRWEMRRKIKELYGL